MARPPARSDGCVRGTTSIVNVIVAAVAAASRVGDCKWGCRVAQAKRIAGARNEKRGEMPPSVYNRDGSATHTHTPSPPRKQGCLMRSCSAFSFAPSQQLLRARLQAELGRGSRGLHAHLVQRRLR